MAARNRVPDDVMAVARLSFGFKALRAMANLMEVAFLLAAGAAVRSSPSLAALGFLALVLLVATIEVWTNRLRMPLRIELHPDAVCFVFPCSQKSIALSDLVEIRTPRMDLGKNSILWKTRASKVQTTSSYDDLSLLVAGIRDRAPAISFSI